MTQYPVISREGAMLALRLKLEGKLEPNPLLDLPPHDHPSRWNAERLAHECSQIVRNARSHTGIAVAECNRGMTPRDYKRRNKLCNEIYIKLAEIVDPCRRHGLEIEFHGDPRSNATVSLQWDSFTTWYIG